jgi:hypothetical protein
MREVKIGILHPPYIETKIDERLIRDATKCAISYYSRVFTLPDDFAHRVIRNLNSPRGYVLFSRLEPIEYSQFSKELATYVEQIFGSSILIFFTDSDVVPISNSVFDGLFNVKGFNNSRNLVISNYLVKRNEIDTTNVLASRVGHELGHLSGLHECDDPSCFMNSYGYNSIGFCKRHKEQLEMVKTSV